MFLSPAETPAPEEPAARGGKSPSLRSALSAQDGQALGSALSSLKGSLAMFSAPGVDECLAILEASASPEGLEQLERELERLDAALEAWVKGDEGL